MHIYSKLMATLSCVLQQVGQNQGISTISHALFLFVSDTSYTNAGKDCV